MANYILRELPKPEQIPLYVASFAGRCVRVILGGGASVEGRLRADPRQPECFLIEREDGKGISLRYDEMRSFETNENPRRQD